MVFVLAESYEAFRNVCMVDWRENYRDPKFRVFVRGDFPVRGRRWQEDDEIRVIGHPGNLARMEFFYALRGVDAPESELAKINVVWPIKQSKPHLKP